MAVPVEIENLKLPATRGKLYDTGLIQIPGIAFADALDASDAIGGVFEIRVPVAGAITAASYYDIADQGINKTLHIYRAKPAGVASDAAWTLTVVESLVYVCSLLLDQKIDGGNAQIIFPAASVLPVWYSAPQGKLWVQVQTAGTDTIASAAVNPSVRLLIHEYEDGAYS